MTNEEKENEKINLIIDSLSEKAKDLFYKNKGSLILGDPHILESAVQLKWIENLSVLKANEIIYEDRVFSDYVDCYSALYKAENIDEAWDQSKAYAYDFLDNYIIGEFHEEDYTFEDGELQPDFLENYSNDILTWSGYDEFY